MGHGYEHDIYLTQPVKSKLNRHTEAVELEGNISFTVYVLAEVSLSLRYTHKDKRTVSAIPAIVSLQESTDVQI